MAQLPRRTPPGEIGEASEAMVFLFLARRNQVFDAVALEAFEAKFWGWSTMVESFFGRGGLLLCPLLAAV